MRALLVSSSAVAALAATLAAAPAAAADLPNAPANYPALGPSPSDAAPNSNPWPGLYVGAGVSAWGGKGVKGGAGGEGYIGYDHMFDNGVVIGVRGSAGYGPFLWSAPNGFTQFTGTAFAGGEAILGYQLGQFRPYVIAGVDFARPTRFGSLSPVDAVNDVFSGPGAVEAVGTVGLGAIYQVTPNFSVGIEARVHNANGGWAPY